MSEGTAYSSGSSITQPTGVKVVAVVEFLFGVISALAGVGWLLLPDLPELPGGRTLGVLFIAIAVVYLAIGYGL